MLQQAFKVRQKWIAFAVADLADGSHEPVGVEFVKPRIIAQPFGQDLGDLSVSDRAILKKNRGKGRFHGRRANRGDDAAQDFDEGVETGKFRRTVPKQILRTAQLGIVVVFSQFPEELLAAVVGDELVTGEEEVGTKPDPLASDRGPVAARPRDDPRMVFGEELLVLRNERGDLILREILGDPPTGKERRHFRIGETVAVACQRLEEPEPQRRLEEVDSVIPHRDFRERNVVCRTFAFRTRPDRVLAGQDETGGDPASCLDDLLLGIAELRVDFAVAVARFPREVAHDQFHQPRPRTARELSVGEQLHEDHRPTGLADERFEMRPANLLKELASVKSDGIGDGQHVVVGKRTKVIDVFQKAGSRDAGRGRPRTRRHPDVIAVGVESVG